MELSTRDRRAVIFGGVGLGLIAVYFLGLEPLARAYGRLSSEHDRLAGRVARALYETQKAAYYTERIAQHEEAFGELVSPKPYDEQVTTVGAQILTAAQTNGLQLRGVTPAEAGPWADDPTLALALFHVDAEVMWENARTAGGSWEQVFKFIASVYRIPGVLSVERLDLSSDIKPGQAYDPNKPGKLTVRLTVSVLVGAHPGSSDPWAS